MMHRTTSYNLEVQSQLWAGYHDLVPSQLRIGQRIELLMAVDVLEHPDQVPDETVEVAETVVDAYADVIEMEVSDAA